MMQPDRIQEKNHTNEKTSVGSWLLRFLVMTYRQACNYTFFKFLAKIMINAINNEVYCIRYDCDICHVVNDDGWTSIVIIFYEYYLPKGLGIHDNMKYVTDLLEYLDNQSSIKYNVYDTHMCKEGHIGSQLPDEWDGKFLHIIGIGNIILRNSLGNYLFDTMCTTKNDLSKQEIYWELIRELVIMKYFQEFFHRYIDTKKCKIDIWTKPNFKLLENKEIKVFLRKKTQFMDDRQRTLE